MRAVLAWALGALPALAGVRTTVAEGNPASARVLEKLGVMRTGAERAHWPERAEPVPLLCYELRAADAGALAR